MSTAKWNVYKIFANGKIAKKPCFEFVYRDDDTAFSHFEDNLRQTLSPKLQNYKFQILKDGVEPAESVNDNSDSDAMTLKRAKILQRHLKNSGAMPDLDSRLDFALILAAESDWKWQWAAVERVTCRYLLGISPPFPSYNEAVEWVDCQM